MCVSAVIPLLVINVITHLQAISKYKPQPQTALIIKTATSLYVIANTARCLFLWWLDERNLLVVGKVNFLGRWAGVRVIRRAASASACNLQRQRQRQRQRQQGASNPEKDKFSKCDFYAKNRSVGRLNYATSGGCIFGYWMFQIRRKTLAILLLLSIYIYV